MRESEGVEKPSGEELHPDSGPRIPAVLTATRPPSDSSQRCAEFSCAPAAESSRGSEGNGGLKRGSEFFSSQPLRTPASQPNTGQRG